ncbi:MAG TPA: ISAs1 family transposase [Actinocrinis sp.]|nr:ISAs1 family transposase [Actinocrinis sp.]
MIELYRLFAQLTDPRKARGIRHHLATVLTVMVFAVLAGARNYREIGDRAADLPAVLLAPAGARTDPGIGELRAPSGSTIRRVAEGIDAQAADLLVCRWLGERAARLANASRSEGACDGDGLFGVAVDGKTVRNSGAGRPEANVKLFSAMLHDEAIVIAQLRVPDATTEITQVKALLDPVALTGAVVTGDAAHTQHTTAQYILDREADYVLTVKGNQPGLLRAIRAGMFTSAIHGYHLEEERGHGRIVRRETWTGPAETIAFPGAAQIFRIRREVCDLAGQMLSVEIVHGVTSLPADRATATAVAAWVRRHWGIENKLHWVRDVVFGEDNQHAYLGASAHTTGIMHNLAISLLRLAGVTEIKRATERIAANRTRILPILAASHT